MEKIKKNRTIKRTAFTKMLNSVFTLAEEASPNKAAILATLTVLEEKQRELDALDQEVINGMIDEEKSDEEFSKEIEAADEYKTKLEVLKVQLLPSVQVATTPPVLETAHSSTNLNGQTADLSRKFKLPKIELQKFSGDPKEWLRFWSIFKKIHEDNNLSKEEKFQYVIQSMVENSRASELVTSYPPTAENYEKVIQSLKNRFGRSDLLVEVYVRELLKLVLNKSRCTLTNIYDKLETHLRALESLGVTTDMCAAMLFPLVESSLPEEILRAWQRKGSIGGDAKDRLETLMKFLEEEVQNEERISLAKLGFEPSTDKASAIGKTGTKQKVSSSPPASVATAAGLLTTEQHKTLTCIFCEASHQSTECEKAKQMTLASRQAAAKQGRACYACLKPGHSVKKCKYSGKCPWCSRRHVLLMCKNFQQSDACEEKTSEPTSKVETLSSLCNTAVNKVNIHLQTLRVKVKGPQSSIVVRALFDTGSHRTYVSRNVAEKLGLKIVGQQTMVHLLFGGERTEPRLHNKYELNLSSMDGSYECHIQAFQEEEICKNIPVIPMDSWINAFKQKNITLTDTTSKDETISLLIGADIAGKLFTGKIQQIQGGPTAIQTKLGWTLMGQSKVEMSQRNDAALLVLSMFSHEAKVTDLWELDVLGIRDPIQTKTKEARQFEVKQLFQQTIRCNDEKRYEVTLPWKENHPNLSNNRAAAERRLQGLTKKLKEEGLFEAYDQVLNEWTQAGIIETIDSSAEGEGYFLPHRHVIKSNSTTPLRPVFDASANGKDGPSLNQCLETGPNLIELIPNLLLRFRENKIGVIADIKRAFLQVSVNPADRDALKFLWWSKNDPKRMVVYRHCRVVFGVVSSPFLLGATIEHHLEKKLSLADSPQEMKFLEKLKESFYVDNCVTSLKSEEESMNFQEMSIAVMREASFELRGWESSDEKAEDAVSSLLGILWNKRRDSLSLNFKFENKVEQPVTKRKILSIAHKIFDPIGMACPTLLQPKILLQKLWSQKLSWDVEVPPEFADEFERWMQQTPMLLDLSVPRWIFGSSEDKISFHVFVDASENAYAAAVFVRVESVNRVQVHLVQAKTRVAPVEITTINRLELLAASIGARLMASVSAANDFSTAKITYWSDSTTVLAWLRRNQQWARFVFNRVSEIRELINVDNWRHVPGAMNPADLPSRGCSIPQLMRSRWWEGPAWLRLPEAEWPEEEHEVNEEAVCFEEKKNNSRTKTVNSNAVNVPSVAITCINVSKEFVSPPIVLKKSNYCKVVRIVAWIFRFINNCKGSSEKIHRGDIDASEFELAEKIVFREAQEECFEGINDKRLRDLNVFVDDFGLIRTKTLIANRVDSFNFKYPVVLDPKHRFTVLLVRYTHETSKHAGVNTTMCLLREQVWIVACRRLVRSVVSKCVKCRRFAGKPIDTPQAILPQNRVKDAAVFEIVGIDFAGPLFLREGKKVWVCVFTCAVYRAVHFELVTTLSTAGFLDSFRRFIARRGRPSVVYTDNGTNFVGANRLLRSIDWERVKALSSVKKIQWIFNPPSAAWWGGWWERIVRILKDLLRRSLGKASLNYEEMSTILCSCESIVNARPITYLPDNNESLVTIAPEFFLKDIREDGVLDLDCVEKNSLSRNLRYRQRLRNELKMRFRSEYLGQLMRRNVTKSSLVTLKCGDIVLIGSDNKKRLEWPIARVLDLIPGNDGVSRIARLKTASGELVRPLKRLILLEGSSDVGERSEAASEINENLSGPTDADVLVMQQDQLPTINKNVTSDDIELIRTRVGREIKKPLRYVQ